jgi:hypothetical protein
LIGSLAVVVIGFFLGMRHATDPDHVIAVTTIVSRQRSIRHAAVIGALWGFGHTITILLVGAMILLSSVVIPPRLGLAMEFSVGFMLILLGGFNLTGMSRWITESLAPAHGHPGEVHTHPHRHGGTVHTHVHAHGLGAHIHSDASSAQSWLDRTLGGLGLYQSLRPLIVGIVHGLAGSAAVALLVLATIKNPLWGIVYLLVFGVGTIAGMMLITVAIAAPIAYTGNRFAGLNQFLTMASGLVSLLFGLFLVYQIGFIDGLFSAHPHWKPQ